MYQDELTNDWTSSAATIVFEAGQRCYQENLHAPLNGGMRVDGSGGQSGKNWAYLVMTALMLPCDR